MALQGSGQISLSDVAGEFGIANSNLSLKTLSDDTGSTTINTCSTSKPDKLVPHKMSEWYSYNHTQGCSLLTTNEGYHSTHDTCKLYFDRTIYHNGSGSLVSVGDDIFTDSGLTTNLAGGNLIWGISADIETGRTFMKVAPNGNVDYTDDCGQRIGFVMSEPLANPTAACAATVLATLKFHGLAGSHSTNEDYRYPGLGDIIYDSQNTSNPTVFVGGNSWYKISGGIYASSSTHLAYQISNGGEVINYQACGSTITFDLSVMNPSQSGICSENTQVGAGFHYGFGEVPAIGDIVYSNIYGQPAPDGWYLGARLGGGGTAYRFHIVNQTVREQLAVCGQSFAGGHLSSLGSSYQTSPCIGGNQTTVYSTDDFGGFRPGDYIYHDSGLEQPWRGVHSYWFNPADNHILTIEDSGLIIERKPC